MWELDDNPQTRAKLRILADYLQAWGTIVKDYREIGYYVDGFAGAGGYTYHGIPVIGSPGIGGRVAAMVEESAARFELRCRFVEADEETCNSLRRAVGRESGPRVQVIRGQFADVVEALVDEIRRAGRPTASFFFVDPYGIRGVSLASVRRVLSLPSTEVLVNLNVPSIRRHIGQVRRLGTLDPLGLEAQAKLTTLYGDDSWRGAWDRASPAQREAELVRLYTDRLNVRYARPYRMCRADTGKLMYYLIHATNNRTATKIIGDIFAREQEAGTLFAPQEVQDLKATLLARYAGQTVCRSGIAVGPGKAGGRRLQRPLGDLVVDGHAVSPTWGLDKDEQYTFLGRSPGAGR